MKFLKYITIALIGVAATACDDIENKEIVQPYTKSDLYYQNLREYKASDHELSFGWFAQYGPDHSYALRFMGLPDSLDICSLWGGVPDPGTELEEEMRFVQRVKGTKMVHVAFPLIGSVPDTEKCRQMYNEGISTNNSELIDESIREYARYISDIVFANDLDGHDSDYEPGGCDFPGYRYKIFAEEIAKYMGNYVGDWTPEKRLEAIRERYGDEVASKPGICDKIFIIDGPCNYIYNSGAEPYCTWVVSQSYGGYITPDRVPEEKIIWASNLGDDWAGSNAILYKFASYKPANGGRKGGFGSFFMHRNYTITDSNPDPYFHFRQCIQIQNPAVHK